MPDSWETHRADHGLPRPATGGELKRVVEAERRGLPFVIYRDAAGELGLFTLTPENATITIGRGEAVALRAEWDDLVSSVHAELERIGDQWLISDQGLSRNGTFVNGSRLSARRRLENGDAIRVGRSVLVYRDAREVGPGATTTVDDVNRLTPITDAQRRVLAALCRPYLQPGSIGGPATNQEVADELHLSVEAVKTHLGTLYKNFGLEALPQNRKRALLAERALALGLVSLGAN
jgi:pSer/pThr/pTyr-binding forkhead associated (FHA) protein